MKQVTYDSEVLKRTSLFDVLQGSGEIFKLKINSLLGSLSVFNGLDLKSLNGLELAGHIVGSGFERLEALLDLIDDGLVLEKRSVGGKVDGSGLLLELLDLATGVLIALLEGLE